MEKSVNQMLDEAMNECRDELLRENILEMIDDKKNIRFTKLFLQVMYSNLDKKQSPLLATINGIHAFFPHKTTHETTIMLMYIKSLMEESTGGETLQDEINMLNIPDQLLRLIPSLKESLKKAENDKKIV